MKGRRRENAGFWMVVGGMTATYLALIGGMIVATMGYSGPAGWLAALSSPAIRHAIWLSLTTCSISAILSLVTAVPVAYFVSRGRFRGKSVVDAALDIPIVLPPMVIGLCLLILFQTGIGQMIERVIPFTYTVYGVVLAQFIVGSAFAIRTMRQTFDDLPARPEEVALTLGASRWQAVRMVTLPAARSGMFAAASIAWARSMGEFGPILVFAGATRMKTEVLPTTVWLELSVGNFEAAIAVSLLMVGMALVVLAGIRLTGERP